MTVLAAVKGRLEAREGADRVAARENLKGALQALSQVQAGDLEVSRELAHFCIESGRIQSPRPGPYLL